MKPRFFLTLLLGLLILSLFPTAALARPAYSGDVEVRDAAGRTITIRSHGDEFFSYLTDAQGNLIYAHEDGYYYYVVPNGSGGLLLGEKVGGEPPTIRSFLAKFFKSAADTQDAGPISVINGIGALKQPLTDLENALAEAKTSRRSFFDLRSVREYAPFDDTADAYAYTDDSDPLKDIWVSPRKAVTNPARKDTCALLVITVDFTDIKCIFNDGDWHKRIFLDGVSTYYSQVSGGKFTYVPAVESYSAPSDGIIHVTLPIQRPGFQDSEVGQNYNFGAKAGFYLDETQEHWYGIFSDASLFAYAAAAADPYINFKQYDGNQDGFISPTELAVMVVLAGQEASYGKVIGRPMSWAHSGTLNNYFRISTGDDKGNILGQEGAVLLDEVQLYKYTLMGENTNPDYDYANPSSRAARQAQFGTPCHELGHDLGLMDLYDTTYNEKNISVLTLSLMSFGCDGMANTPNAEPGSSPAMLDPHSKIFLGFYTEQVVTENGLYYLNESSDYAKANILRVNTDTEGVYYLIENRTFTGYDVGLRYLLRDPGGLVYWRIDETVVNQHWRYNHINSNIQNCGYGIMPVYITYRPKEITINGSSWLDYSDCKPFRNLDTSALEKEYFVPGTEQSLFSFDAAAPSMKLWIAPLPFQMEPKASFPQGNAPSLVAKLDYDDPSGNDLIHVTDLDQVVLGGAPLREPNEFVARDGSLLIDFNPAFLNTLPQGNYPLLVSLKNGLHASTSIQVTTDPPGGDNEPDIPNAGDSSHPLAWAGLMLLAAGGRLLVRRRRRACNASDS